MKAATTFSGLPIVAFALFVCLGTAVCSGQTAQKTNQRDSADEAVVKSVVDHWRQAWERFDASVLRGDYAADADWLNAFGVRKKGDDILLFVAQVLKRPGVQARRTAWGEIQVRFVRPDVAIAYRDYQTLGMKSIDGRDLGERRTHANWLLTKEGGNWRIASQVISDEVQ